MPFIWIRVGTYEGWALVDSGAWVNVLPYSLGLGLGLNWDDFPDGAMIGGSVVSASKKVRMKSKIRGFDELELQFAWLSHDNARLILGHDDFFRNFDVYFSTINQTFVVTQAKKAKI
jgi:hypothetical protein